jgi:pimeloyl-ACP methyl ester carboxylesterase
MGSPISFFDHFNATALIVVTPERNRVKKWRKELGGLLPKNSGVKHIKPKFITINGIKVRYARGGQNEGATLLMLCPLPQSILAFDQIWPALAEKYQLVALDIPGFGGSEGGVEYMTFKAQGEFLAAFVKEMGIETPHVLGPDVGMPAALAYALQQENEIASLIVGDGPGIQNPSCGSAINKMIDWAFWRVIFTTAGAGAFVEGANRICYLRYCPSDEEVADYVASYKHRIPAIMKWFKTYPQNLATIDPAIESMEIPTKVFWGESDMLLFSSDAQRIGEKIKHSDVTVFKDCGHFPYQDQSEAFAKMLIDWIDGGYTKV